ncbi:hypothetical protein L830_5009 [Mycobacteroides abscessus MAB_082312_2258]|nr:hypothetical protein L830_5009 [Mycobacteroides abscessus MAB_082312_2258]
MKTGAQALISGLTGLAVFGAALFWPAGTFHYWQAWVFLAIFVVCSGAPRSTWPDRIPQCCNDVYAVARWPRRARCRNSRSPYS